MHDLADYQHFCDSGCESAPPAAIGAELQALWWARKAEWGRAHQIVQDVETNAAALVHAHLHRVEGDRENANYWYARAGESSTDVVLAIEWETLTKRLLAQASADSALR